MLASLSARTFSAAAGFILSFTLLPYATYVPPGRVCGLVTRGPSHDAESPGPQCSLTVADGPIPAGDRHGESRVDGDGEPSPPVQKPPLEAAHAIAPSQSRTPGGAEAARIDWEFIAAREGGQRLAGYVVRTGNNRSGVTVATGVDLGQRSPADIDGLRIPEELKSTLKRYATKKGTEARAYLESHPLILTKPEADAIDTVVRESIAGSLRKRFANAVMGRGDLLRFEELPPEAQTVIASVAFQYGPNLKRSTPRFWASVTCQDWEKAAEELGSFGDRYAARRTSEARLLLEAARRVRVSPPPPAGAGL